MGLLDSTIGTRHYTEEMFSHVWKRQVEKMLIWSDKTLGSSAGCACGRLFIRLRPPAPQLPVEATRHGRPGELVLELYPARRGSDVSVQPIRLHHFNQHPHDYSGQLAQAFVGLQPSCLRRCQPPRPCLAYLTGVNPCAKVAAVTFLEGQPQCPV